MRSRALIAIAGALAILWLAVVQCGVINAPAAPKLRHEALEAAGQAGAPQVASEHAHVDASPHVTHEAQAVAPLPRTDTALRLSAAAAAVAAAVVGALLAVPAASRGPPAVRAPARRGRAILADLCIARC
jgi:hypothetical protein